MPATSHCTPDRRFHSLTYIGESDINGKPRYGLFRCDCGTKKIINITDVIKGRTKSCGCLARSRNFKDPTTHGRSMIGDRAYKTWSSMKARCNNADDAQYYRYGGRGITVCERWMESFENFLEDMGDPPPRMTLDRRDNNLGYSPGNCRWATAKEQARNRRSNSILEFNGERLTAVEWSERTGISKEVISYRLQNGWPIEKVLRAPPRQKLDPIERDGISMTPREWEKALGFNYGTIIHRVKKGLTGEQLFAPVLQKHKRK